MFGSGSGVGGVLLALAVLWPATAVAEEPARKDVLLLYADSMLLPANVVVDRELRSRLGADTATPVRFYTEALDLSWFPDEEVARPMLDLLRAKYANRNLALVIPVGPPAPRFALLHRATIFPGVPVVFVAAREAVLADLPLPPDVTGMWMDRDWRANVELILRLHPDTRRIAFVSGGGMTPSTAAEFNRVAASFRDRFEPIELTDRTFEEMLEQAAALPEHTVILVGLFLRDRAGRTFTNAEVAEHLARAASVPVYSALDVHVGRGIVGGYVVRWEQQAARAAALALRVLRGERLGPADATSEGTNAYVFDDRVLKRWRIDRRRLPPEASCYFMSRPSGSSTEGTSSGPSVCSSFRAGSSESCWCSVPSAVAPSEASPSACGSRPSSRTSRQCCRPARSRRSTGRSRPGSGASSRIWAWTGPPSGRWTIVPARPG